MTVNGEWGRKKTPALGRGSIENEKHQNFVMLS